MMEWRVREGWNEVWRMMEGRYGVMERWRVRDVWMEVMKGTATIRKGVWVCGWWWWGDEG